MTVSSWRLRCSHGPMTLSAWWRVTICQRGAAGHSSGEGDELDMVLEAMLSGNRGEAGVTTPCEADLGEAGWTGEGAAEGSV
jgi:hypothetical protein